MKFIRTHSTSNSSRHRIAIKKNILSKNNKFIKNLLIGKKSFNGRSATTGRITVRHKGGGAKKNYRLVHNINGTYCSLVLGINYDPNKNIFIALNFNLLTHSFFYSPAIHKIYVGALLVCGDDIDEIRIGYRLKLANIPVGSLICYLSENKQSKYIKSAGSYGQLVEKSYRHCKVKLPSGAILSTISSAYATIGTLSNPNHNKIVIGKAGRNRLIGIRPSTRGVAMNPVDHPHGGRSNGGFISKTPWGKITRGKKTKKI